MLSETIRKKFLSYFEKNGHKILGSSPVVSRTDPSLLFINAGMNPFKENFLGKMPPQSPKVASIQKCLRAGGKHNDLENVGHTNRHLTFFEMLGNFSFGDYFKKEAIAYAFEVSMEIFQLPYDLLWATVYEEDDESFELWKKHLPESRIVRMGKKDNFWSMGEFGPCGPCSELYLDKGPQFSKASSPLYDADGERYCEFWNLVFMEKENTQKGLVSLPAKNIDTGSGLERVLSLIEGKNSVFETDVLAELIESIKPLSQKPYNPSFSAHFRIIADHIRALSFAIADKSAPSNTKEGYVLRKILRRAARSGKALGIQGPFLAKLLPVLCKTMGGFYPELIERKEAIASILQEEEESYSYTLEKGGALLNSLVESPTKKHLSGEEAFKLKDTYGLPLDEILLLSKDLGLDVDIASFRALEKKAQELSKGAKKEDTAIAVSLFNSWKTRSIFHEDRSSLNSSILGILKEGEFVDQLKDGEKGMVILDQTPFYPEKGGQVGDLGHLSSEKGCFTVFDTKTPVDGVIVQIGTMTEGYLEKGDIVHAKINASLRKNTASNHTGVHLLQWALRKQFGDSLEQQGSLVDSSKLRLDFSLNKAPSSKELQQVEEMVQKKILENTPIKTYEMPYEKASSDPSILQFFGDKYGDKVRVVDIDFSKELCGGTHAKATGDLGTFVIVKESAIAKGIRRIEAKTGLSAFAYLQSERALLSSVQSLFKAPKEALLEKIEKEKIEKEVALKTLKSLEKKALKELIEHLAKKTTGSPPTLAEIVDVPFKELPTFAEDLTKKCPRSVIILGSSQNGRCQLIVRVDPKLPLDAKALIQKVAHIIDGGGGGKKHAATAGGKKPENLPLAIETLKTFIQES